MANVLELAGVRKIFRDFWGRPRVCALVDVDLAVAKGEIFALLGRNGAGKSTLMQICLGLLRPTAGRVAVLGGSPGDLAVRRRIGYLPEESYLHGFLTARETLLFHAGLCGLPGDAALARAEYLLDLVELRDAARRPVTEFSKGMLRRLCLAQALIGDPELLFLDEPTSGLDPISAAAFDELIRDLSDSLDLTVFMITHDLDSLYTITDQVAVLADKKVVAMAPVRELEKSDHPWIQEYFGGPRGRMASGSRAARGAR